MTSIYPDEHRRLFQEFPTGVCVVAAASPHGGTAAMTCSSLTSVSTDPPTLLVSLRRGCATTEAISQSAVFAVYLLASSASHLGEFFALEDSRKKAQIGEVLGRDVSSAPVDQLGLIPQRHAYGAAYCSVVRWMDIGTHRIVVGRIKQITMPSQSLGQGPLVRHKACYTTTQKGSHVDQ